MQRKDRWRTIDVDSAIDELTTCIDRAIAADLSISTDEWHLCITDNNNDIVEEIEEIDEEDEVYVPSRKRQAEELSDEEGAQLLNQIASSPVAKGHKQLERELQAHHQQLSAQIAALQQVLQEQLSSQIAALQQVLQQQLSAQIAALQQLLQHVHVSAAAIAQYKMGNRYAEDLAQDVRAQAAALLPEVEATLAEYMKQEMAKIDAALDDHRSQVHAQIDAEVETKRRRIQEFDGEIARRQQRLRQITEESVEAVRKQAQPTIQHIVSTAVTQVLSANDE